MYSAVAFIAVMAVAFALGSCPNGVIVGRVFYHTDIRKTGSGNIGTTNAIRALGKKGGYAVFLLDFAKGILAGLVGWLVVRSCASGTGVFTAADVANAAFFGAVLGHIFSPWLGFHGGKGIATSVACLFFTFGPAGALIELASFIVVVAATKYVSAGSLTAAVLCPFLSLYYYWGDPVAWALSTAVAVTVIWAHRANIGRLRAGTESRIGKGKGSSSSDAKGGKAA